MTTTHWRNAVTGDFAKSGKWDDGRPGIKDDAIIAATGTDYTVKVISADAAHSLTLDSADATLLEKAQGSLHLGSLDIESGTAILKTANTIGSIVMTGGELEFSKSAALGSAALSLSGEAILSATADAKIANNIAVNEQGSIAVGDGATLKLEGALTFDNNLSESLKIIGSGANGAGDGTGVVDLDGNVGAMSSAHPSTLTLKGATLGSSVADSSSFGAFISSVHEIVMQNQGSLDLTNQDNITLPEIEGREGRGEIVNSGPLENLTLGNGGTYAFFGIKGDFDITMDTTLVGKIALKPGDVIHVINSGGFDHADFIGNAPAFDLEAPGGSGELDCLGNVTGAPVSVDLGTGQNNKMYVDFTFTGTISNFGGHDGGTDVIQIVVGGEVGVTPTLHYEPNEAGTGGTLVVQFGTSPALDLNLEGTYTQSDFTLNPLDRDEIDCSAEQPPPHVPAHVLDALI